MNWTDTTAELSIGDYATSYLLARRGTTPSDGREVPLGNIPVKDVNWWREFYFNMEAPALTDEFLAIYPVAQRCQIPINLANAQVIKRPGGVNPGSSWILRLFKNSTQIGTITISSSGTITLATTGATSYTLDVGDVLSVQAPTTSDSSIRGWGFNIMLLAIN